MADGQRKIQFTTNQPVGLAIIGGYAVDRAAANRSQAEAAAGSRTPGGGCGGYAVPGRRRLRRGGAALRLRLRVLGEVRTGHRCSRARIRASTSLALSSARCRRPVDSSGGAAGIGSRGNSVNGVIRGMPANGSSPCSGPGPGPRVPSEPPAGDGAVPRRGWRSVMPIVVPGLVDDLGVVDLRLGGALRRLRLQRRLRPLGRDRGGADAGGRRLIAAGERGGHVVGLALGVGLAQLAQLRLQRFEVGADQPGRLDPLQAQLAADLLDQFAAQRGDLRAQVGDLSGEALGCTSRRSIACSSCWNSCRAAATAARSISPTCRTSSSRAGGGGAGGVSGTVPDGRQPRAEHGVRAEQQAPEPADRADPDASSNRSR